ncbi:MAG TPA: HAD family phosphatase [Paraburkholderia sp.]|jgi:HAD superfamily hydrolase (TIGR01509 family)|nr:HAD family phosphatase [Paraburkholderia sp.]
MNPSIKLVLFDMEGVLSHYDRAVRTDRLSRITGKSPDAVRHAIWESGLEARADAGEISDADYLLELGNLLGRTVSVDEWLDARHASITPNAQSLAVAAQVAARHPIAVLTNNCRLVTDHIGFLNPGVARLFGSHVYPSAAFGAAKPAARAYLGCVGQFGVDARDTLFIDDSDANVQGAIDAGLHAYKFIDAHALSAELARWNLV